MVPDVKGFAVVDHTGAILVRTVSPSANAAMVNYLIVGAGVVPLNSWSDAQVAAVFAREARGCFVARVTISVETEG